jgi:two-component system, chemotaxis family, protein-glutamate methylesterase/glutaminase
MNRELTGLICPDCYGPLERHNYGGVTELKCRVGHAYSPESAIAAQEEAEERSLWTALQMVEQSGILVEKLAPSLSEEEVKAAEARILAKRSLANRLRTLIEGHHLAEEGRMKSPKISLASLNGRSKAKTRVGHRG